MTVTKVSACRVCGGKLRDVFSLGEQYVSDFVTEGEGLKAPLDLVQCETCTLIQLRHTVDRNLLYRTYWYKSGTQEAMVKALQDVIAGTVSRVREHKEHDIWVDIGANDGTLLKYVPTTYHRCGFEPAENLAREAEKITDIFIIHDFFNNWVSIPVVAPIKVATAIAMFYDLEDPNKFCANIKKTLAPDGVFVIQMNYLLTMLERNTYENISHEHLEYYSLKSLQFLLARHGLEVFDVELNDVNGGSIRTYISHKGAYPAGWRVFAAETLENARLTQRAITDFAERVAQRRRELIQLLHQIKREGKTIMGYGASSRGNTILQYCNIDSTLLTAIADRNPEKHGRFTVGSGIPICSEETMRKANPSHLLILPYHFEASFREREEQYLKNGGHFIIPLPNVKVIP